MDKAYELKYHEQEEKNWWFVARRDFILRQLKEQKIPLSAKILDIGSAGGVLSLELIQNGYKNVFALDYSADAIARCKERGIQNAFVMDGHQPDFSENEFDVLIASDCLEHLENDQLALMNWFKVLKPEGLAFIYVPAYQWLWSQHDEINFHFRRYTETGLNNKLKIAGFTLVQSGYWNFMIFFPTALVRFFQKLVKVKHAKEEQKDQLVLLPKGINSLLSKWVILENKIASKIKYPFGVSTFSIAKKEIHD